MWQTVFECSDGIERPSFALDTFIVKGGKGSGEAYDLFLCSRNSIKDNYDSDLYDDLRDRNKTFRISIMQTERIVYSDRTSWAQKCTNPLVDGINTFDDFKTIKIEEKVE